MNCTKRFNCVTIQTDGIPLLKQAICELYPGAAPANLLVTNGSAEANFVTIWRLVEAGDKVAVMYPNYLQVPGIVHSCGATVEPFYMREENGWAPDLDRLRQEVSGKTRLILYLQSQQPHRGGFEHGRDARDRYYC